MPSPAAQIGASLAAYVPDDDTKIADGYTEIRFFVAASEAGSYAQATAVTLVSGQKDYSYNHTTALATDWFYWQLYGATPGSGPASPPMPVGPPQTTRKQIRQGVGTRLNMLEVVTATGSSSTVFTAPELIDPDRSVHTVGSYWARPVSGSYQVTRRIRAGAAGYTNLATGEVTVGRAFTGTLAASTEVEIWRPRGEVDVAARVDEAMQRARLELWWEDTWYFTADDSVSDYYLPRAVRKAAVKRVEWAADTYPTRPGWRPVDWWDIVEDGQQPLLTVLASASGHQMYAAGTVFRIVYNRFGDRMDDDSDYWGVDLEWCVTEVAYEYLFGQLNPSGGREDVGDVVASQQALLEECARMRALYMPSPPNPHMRLAR